VQGDGGACAGEDGRASLEDRVTSVWIYGNNGGINSIVLVLIAVLSIVVIILIVVVVGLFGGKKKGVRVESVLETVDKGGVEVEGQDGGGCTGGASGEKDLD